MSYRYSHLLSPLKIGNVLLKNRMLQSNAMPHYLQGAEMFPSDAIISFMGNIAKNGAAVVTCVNRVMVPLPKTGSGPHSAGFDINDPNVRVYFSHLTDAIHFYDSRASIALRLGVREEPDTGSPGPGEYSISDITEQDLQRPEMLGLDQTAKGIPARKIQEMIEGTAEFVRFYQSVGFDMINIHASYRASILAHSLSPAINRRQDKYGGNLENRARLILELCQAIKKACGQDFLIELQISGEEKAGCGYTLEDTVKYARLWAGAVDILQLRAWDVLLAHPTGFNSRKKYPITLRYAQAIKESGAKIVTAPVGGFQDLDLNEEYIATGRTDMIAMARAFICDPEYGKKAYEGRGEDIVPCIRCHKCNIISTTGPWNSVCSVNPALGIGHRVNRMIDPPGSPKKVAVIGGGPAGMKAAVVAAENGHQVTLYEKNPFLGGQLRHADFASFKWPLRDFKDYLVRQVSKSGVEVLLNTEATPGMIRTREYDAVIVAAGAEPIIPDIPGANGKNIWKPIDVYGNDKVIGRNVVVIGGAQIGVETGMYLAENGHNVTVLTRRKELERPLSPVPRRGKVQDVWEALDTFSYITEAVTTAISEGKVTYVDPQDKAKSINTDSVVVSAGLNPRQEEALTFYGTAERFFVVGDCRAVGSVQTCMRSAFATASLI